MSIIKLTVTERDGKALTTPAGYGFDTNDIVSPIIRDKGNTYSYFFTRMMKGVDPQSRNLGKIMWKVEESLADIQLLSHEIALLNVNERRGVQYPSPQIFIASRVSEGFTPVTSGTSFYYIEDGDPLAVNYIVDETIDEIIDILTPDAVTPGHVIADEGVDLPQRGRLNFVGAGATVTDGPGDDTTVTIPGSMPMMVTNIDMDTAFVAGVLTIPPAFQEYDSFNLINGSGSNISEIVGLSTQPLKVQRFTVELGSTQNFVHSPVATATANQLISDAALTNPVIGDEAGMIEYEVVTIAGPIQVNRRYNATLPA